MRAAEDFAEPEDYEDGAPFESLSTLRRFDLGEPPPATAPRRHPPDECAQLVADAHRAGIKSVQLVAWRDLDDPEAGGSELHSHRIASAWAQAGLDVTFRSSAVAGRSALTERCGYHVVRRNGRYLVFPAVAWDGMRSRRRSDALVEVWNGMPFFSPLWFRGPSIVFLHHVHAEMWKMVLPGSMAALGNTIESTIAPLLYRRSAVVTLSESSRDEIVSMLHLPARRVRVVAPGVDPSFTPGGSRSNDPLVVAVGRLVPVKRFDLLIEALCLARKEHPSLRAVIVGEGYERDRLEAMRREADAVDWLDLPGRLEDAALRSLYREAWMVASTSQREGWGMTLTEAGACGTPGVASRIAGHRDAVLDGETGLLADGAEQFAAAMSRMIADAELRRRMGSAAREHALRYTWDATAASTLRALVGQAQARERRAPRFVSRETHRRDR